MLEAIPSKPEESRVADFQQDLRSVSNNAVSRFSHCAQK